MPPNRSQVVVTTLAAWSGSVTSQTREATRPPLSSIASVVSCRPSALMSVARTEPPREAKSVALARPIEPPAPVTAIAATEWLAGASLATPPKVASPRRPLSRSVSLDDLGVDGDDLCTGADLAWSRDHSGATNDFLDIHRYRESAADPTVCEAFEGAAAL